MTDKVKFRLIVDDPRFPVIAVESDIKLDHAMTLNEMERESLVREKLKAGMCTSVSERWNARIKNEEYNG